MTAGRHRKHTPRYTRVIAVGTTLTAAGLVAGATVVVSAPEAAPSGIEDAAPAALRLPPQEKTNHVPSSALIAQRATIPKTQPRREQKPSKRTTTARKPAKHAVTITNSSGAVAKAVRIALAQRGVMYRWGGTSPAGFDCSGLIQYAYKQAGINLPRTSSALSGIGRHVPLSHVQPGDILYWPGHVALAIGNGQLVEASTRGRPVATRAIYGEPLVRRVG